jgi:hypothetical protein
MSAELVPRVEPLLPMDSGSARQAMNAYQETTRAMLDARDWIGTPGQPESFVKRSGWSKIANAYGLSTELLREDIERSADHAEGEPVRAHAVVRAISKTGRYADGDGACAVNEPRFRNASGRQKLEHDLPATAVTRATNRAISNLVGFGQVSAEEVDADVRAGAAQIVDERPTWATFADDAAVLTAANALVAIVQAAGGDPASVTRVGQLIREQCDGGVPLAVVNAIAGIYAAVGSAPAPEGEQPPPPAPDASYDQGGQP